MIALVVDVLVAGAKFFVRAERSQRAVWAAAPPN